MDTRRAILWMIFLLSLLFLWNNWQIHTGQPSLFGGAPTEQAQPADSTSGQASETVDASVPGAADVSVPGAAEASSEGAAAAVPQSSAAASPTREPVVVTTDVLRLSFDPQGARLIKAELLQYEAVDNPERPVVLMNDAPDGILYTAETGVVGPQGAEFPTHRTPFELVAEPQMLSDGGTRVQFAAEQGNLQVIKTYTLPGNSYDIQVSHELRNLGAEPVSPSVYFQISRDDASAPGDSTFYRTFTGPAVYTEEGKFQKVDFSDIAEGKAEYTRRADNGWIAMIQHYFVSAWVPEQGAPRVNDLVSLGNNVFAVRSVEPVGAIAPNESRTVSSQLWVGPQDQNALEAVAPGLDLVVDYGWFTVIAKPLFIVMTWLYGWLGNWGWTIVALTVLIKLVFFPLSAASYRSMARMKAVAPRLTALREKYGDDRQKMNAAMMELYRNEKINPLGGCLPIAVQIPVFISLYWVLLASAEMRGAPWILWVQDLSARDPYFILPAIMMATMFLQIKLNPTPPDPMQARIMMLMPLIFGGMMFFFPSGLVLYWVVNNILSIGQQYYITRKMQNEPVGKARKG